MIQVTEKDSLAWQLFQAQMKNSKENNHITQIMHVTIRILNIKCMKVNYVLGEQTYWWSKLLPEIPK